MSDQLWSRLGIGTVNTRRLARGPRYRAGRRLDGELLEYVLFALVAGRALAPSSKLEATRRIRYRVCIPGQGSPSAQRFITVRNLKQVKREVRTRGRMVQTLSERIEGPEALDMDSRAQMRREVRTKPGVWRYLRAMIRRNGDPPWCRLCGHSHWVQETSWVLSALPKQLHPKAK